MNRMVTSADLISLAFNPELVANGITVTCRWLVESAGQSAAPGYPHVRERVAQICLELAFRRYVSQASLPHRFLDHTPFSEPQHRDIALGGRRCVLVPSLVSRSSLISRIRQEAGILLDFPLPVTPGGGASDQPEDLYIFGFLLGTVTPSLRTLQKAVAAGRPIHLLHWLPSRCQYPRERPKGKGKVGTLTLVNEGNQPITLELSGHGDNREPLVQRIHLPPGELNLETSFSSLSNLQVRELPGGDLSIHSSILGEVHRVQPIDWGNLWIYGEQIILAGYLTVDEYRQAARRQRAAQLSQPPAGWLEPKKLPVMVLKPLPYLFNRVGAWGAI